MYCYFSSFLDFAVLLFIYCASFLHIRPITALSPVLESCEEPQTFSFRIVNFQEFNSLCARVRDERVSLVGELVYFTNL